MLPPFKINSNILGKLLCLLRYHFMITMEIYSSKKRKLWWGQFWNLFSVTFTCQLLKIRFLITNIYLTYADDILILASSTNKINTIQETFQNNSAINFTHEIKINNKISPDIGIMVRVFTNGPGELDSIPERVIPMTQKLVLDASLLNTQHYKAWTRNESGAILGKE